MLTGERYLSALWRETGVFPCSYIPVISEPQCCVLAFRFRPRADTTYPDGLDEKPDFKSNWTLLYYVYPGAKTSVLVVRTSTRKWI